MQIFKFNIPEIIFGYQDSRMPKITLIFQYFSFISTYTHTYMYDCFILYLILLVVLLLFIFIVLLVLIGNIILRKKTILLYS